MFVKQLSVFIENREGRLEQVTEVLKEQDINILSPQHGGYHGVRYAENDCV